MTAIVIQPASSKEAQDHYRDTVLTPVKLPDVAHLLGAERESLRKAFPGGEIRLWGVTTGATGRNRGYWEKVRPGDIAFFSAENYFFAASTVVMTFHNKDLADYLWGVDGHGSSWEYMYALGELRSTHIAYQDFGRLAGYKLNWVPQGFVRLDVEKSEKVLSAYDFFSPQYASVLQDGEGGAVGTLVEAQLSRPFDEPLEQAVVSYLRKEQRLLRDTLIPELISKCDLCGTELPKACLVAAHIKKRSLCTDDEKRDIPNVAMAACVFGCDYLFEKGYVTVDSQGRVIVTSRFEDGEQAMRTYLEPLKGAIFGRDFEPRATYFEFHRDEIFRG